MVSLDAVYVAFVEARYPELYLPKIGQVIAQHYQTILAPLDGGKARAMWQDYVGSLIDTRSGQHRLLAVEGYLLFHVLEVVQAKLASKAVVVTVEVRARQYYVASDIKTIHLA